MAGRTDDNETTIACTGMTLSCNRIPVFTNGCGDGACQGALRGNFGEWMWIETSENDDNSWNKRPNASIIGGTGHGYGQNRIYLGNVGSNAHIATTVKLDLVSRVIGHGEFVA